MSGVVTLSHRQLAGLTAFLMYLGGSWALWTAGRCGFLRDPRA